MAHLFGEFGNVPRLSMVRDDPENLMRLASIIREFGQTGLELKRGLGSKEKPELEALISSLNQLISSTEMVTQTLQRKAQILQGM